MNTANARQQQDRSNFTWAADEDAAFHVGDRVTISTRRPVGHHHVPSYLRGKTGTVESVIEPMRRDDEGDERKADRPLHRYRIAFAMSDLWPAYVGPPARGLRIEVFENWLATVER